MFGSNGIRLILLLRSYNTKEKRGTREIQFRPTLRRYLEEYEPNLRKDYLFPGRHGPGHIHKASADKILRDAFHKVGIEGASTHTSDV
jgi:integrase/recombinase XerD